MSEWEDFKVGPKFNSPDCIPFDYVSHTSHVSSAINIIEAGEVRPSLVFDESKLNDQRILVTWLSPNHWTTGFRYGNIRFDFPFDKLIQGKRCYWVESIAYKVKACRILITDINHDSQLEPYDPTSKTGPWWFDHSNDQHYFNSKHCLEFMIEAPVRLRLLKKLDFVHHHQDYCSVHRNDPAKCSELGFNSSLGGAVFLTRAAVMGVGLGQFSKHFVKENGDPTKELYSTLSEYYRSVSCKVDFSGSLTDESESSIAAMRAIMSAFTFGPIADAKLLCAMFQSKHVFINVAARVLAETVGLKLWDKLADDKYLRKALTKEV